MKNSAETTPGGHPSPCTFGTMVVFDVENALSDSFSPEKIDEFRAHEQVCEYCKFVRNKIGGSIFPPKTKNRLAS